MQLLSVSQYLNLFYFILFDLTFISIEEDIPHILLVIGLIWIKIMIGSLKVNMKEIMVHKSDKIYYFKFVSSLQILKMKSKWEN